MSPRFKVLYALLLATPVVSMSAVDAQPPDANTIANNATPAEEQPIELITEADFYRQIGGLTRLKLNMEKATITDIAAEIQKQTGLEISTSGGMIEPPKDQVLYSVEASGQPLWEAIGQWSRDGKKLDLVNDYRSNNRWVLTEWAGPPQIGITLGPFYLVANNIIINRSRSLHLDNKDAKPNVTNQTTLQSQLKTDPKLQPMVAAIITEVDGATDDKGRTIAPNTNDFNHSQRDNVTLSLEAPAADATRLQSLKGRVRVAAIVKQEHWEIDIAATPTAEKLFKSDTAEVTYRFDGLTAMAGGGWSAKMHIERKAIGPQRVFKAKAQWSQNLLSDFGVILSTIRFVDSANAPMISNAGGGTGTMGNPISTYDLTININAPRPDANGLLPDATVTPAKIIIDVPLEYREVSIPFEFKDVPLP